jgi:hypothetical protein
MATSGDGQYYKLTPAHMPPVKLLPPANANSFSTGYALPQKKVEVIGYNNSMPPQYTQPIGSVGEKTGMMFTSNHTPRVPSSYPQD